MTGPLTIDVLVLSYGKDAPRRTATLNCLKSLRDQTTRHQVRVFVAESQRGEEPAAQYRAVFQNCGAERSYHTLHSSLPFNFNETVQAGIAFMDRFPPPDPQANNAILISNNDVVYAADCLERLTDALQTVDSASPWMPGYHDRLHEKSEATENLLLGYDVRRHIAGWSYAFNRRILAQNAWLTPERWFPLELPFWFQDNFYADVLEQYQVPHALVRDARAEHLSEQSHDLLPDRHSATIGMQQAYNRCRARLRSTKKPRMLAWFEGLASTFRRAA